MEMEGSFRRLERKQLLNVKPIDRAADDRPYIIPPGGGKKKLYTRSSKLASALDDPYGLDLWHQRNLALGLADNHWILNEIVQNSDDVKELNALCEIARDKSGERKGSCWGTVIHWFTECIDQNLDWELCDPNDDVKFSVKYLRPDIDDPNDALMDIYEEAWEDLTAYEFTMKQEGLFSDATEMFVVCDEVRAAGTLDRIYRQALEAFIGDLKTGRIDLSIMKFTMQLAIYAHSATYQEFDDESWKREDLSESYGVSLKEAILVHLPAKAGECALMWLDIEAGWEAIKFALDLRELRRVGKKWARGFNEPKPEPVPMLPPDAKTIKDFRDFAHTWNVPLEGATKKADILEVIKRAEGKVFR